MAPRFFFPSPLVAGIELTLPPNVAHHAAQVLRLKRGDAVTLFDGSGGEYDAQVIDASSRAVDVRVNERSPIERESPFEITLVQALIASERMDQLVQKAVELGAVAIVPVATARSVTRLDPDRARRRVEHWRQIVVASCEQCGRNRLPVVHAPCELGAWLAQPTADSQTGSRLLLAPSATESLGHVAPAASMEILIGPEGGLSPEEESAAVAAGFHAVRLGPRILRTETAGPAMLAAMNALWGDWR